MLRWLAQAPAGRDYLGDALADRRFFDKSAAGQRWEGLLAVLGIGTLGTLGITAPISSADCAKAFEQMFWSMLETERHNNGGWGANECASGTPYAIESGGGIETCSMVSWCSVCVLMLRRH